MAVKIKIDEVLALKGDMETLHKVYEVVQKSMSASEDGDTRHLRMKFREALKRLDSLSEQFLNSELTVKG